jgi:hypothetical protein
MRSPWKALPITSRTPPSAIATSNVVLGENGASGVNDTVLKL